jgi:site-specific DNA-methyltransferase (adenine-specific)
LVSLRKSTQDAPKHVYAFVPDIPLDKVWSDSKLYARYGLTNSEIEYIESQVADHEDSFDDISSDEAGDE